MQIRVDDIKEEPLELASEEAAESFPVLLEAAAEEGFTFLAPLSTRLRIFRVDAMLEVEGAVQSRIRLSCSRCLAEYEEPLSSRFALTFVRELPEVADEAGDDEIELSADEMGLTLFHGDEIDLGAAIVEQVLMALPMHPLCRQECRGLCPQCGINLNEGSCSCEQPVFNSKFAALKNLKLDK